MAVYGLKTRYLNPDDGWCWEIKRLDEHELATIHYGFDSKEAALKDGKAYLAAKMEEAQRERADR